MTTKQKSNNSGYGILIAGILFGGLYLLSQKSTENPNETTGIVLFRSKPVESTVYLNNIEVGNTPLSLKLEPGQYDWKMIMDGNPDVFKTGKFVLTTGETKTIQADFSQTEDLSFVIDPPIPAPVDIYAGTVVTVQCPVTSTSNVATTVKAVIELHFGSILPGTGSLIKTIAIPQFMIASGETRNMIAQWTEIEPAGRRDIVIKIQKPTGEELGSKEFDDAYMVLQPEQPEFEFIGPSITPNPARQGENVSITCPVSCTGGVSVTVKARIEVHFGSIMPGTGALIKAFDIPAFQISSGDTKNFNVNMTEVEPDNGRRDIQVYIISTSGEELASKEFDDAYRVEIPDPLQFSFGQPTALPDPVMTGQQVKITCPVSCTSGSLSTLRVHVEVHYGSILPGTGDLIKAFDFSTQMGSGTSKNFEASFIEVEPDNGRRDVQVYVFNTLNQELASREFDDAYYVEAALTTGILDVSFSPSNAIVKVNGSRVYNGGSYDLPAGTYSWTASASGYTSKSGTLTIKAGKTTNLDFDLVQSTGSLVVNFSPSNATVLVDGDYVSNGRIYSLSPGTYYWTATASGYVSKSGEVTINANQTTTLNITLTQVLPKITAIGKRDSYGPWVEFTCSNFPPYAGLYIYISGKPYAISGTCGSNGTLTGLLNMESYEPSGTYVIIAYDGDGNYASTTVYVP